MEWYHCSYSGGNLDSMLDTHGVTYLAQTFGNNRGLPFAGTTEDIPAEGFSEWVKKVRSGFYTMKNGGKWMQSIILKHRNGHGDGTGYTLYIYSDLVDKTVRSLKWNKIVNNEIIGNDLTILDSGNYSNHINQINNQLILNKGSYVAKEVGANGTAGYVKFAQIKIKATYANYPCVFLISGRGRAMPTFVAVYYQSYDGLYPDIVSFTKFGNCTYNVYIKNETGGVWSLFAPKNEAYGRVDILAEYISTTHFEVTHPDTLVSEIESSWIAASLDGDIKYANTTNALKDTNNGNTITASYSKAALAASAISYLVCWNGYELRAVPRTSFLGTKSLNNYYGMTLSDGTDTAWIRTTSQGIIPYEAGSAGSGHCQLGTETWYFLKSYIDNMYGKYLELSGTVTAKGIRTASLGNTIGDSNLYWNLLYINSIYLYNTSININGTSSGLNMTSSYGFKIKTIYQKPITFLTSTVTSSTGDQGVQLVCKGGSTVPCLEPYSDDMAALGSSSKRWHSIYSKDSTISTSDRNEKEQISYIGEPTTYDTSMSDEIIIEFVRGLRAVIFKRKNGESGRPHHGFIAQDLEKLLQKLGIKDHAGFIKSPKTETIEIEEEVEETCTDETDGQIKTRTVMQKREEQREIPGEYVYGLRYEEFIADIVRFVQLQDEKIEKQERKINSLEERLSALENMLNSSTN